MARKKKEVEEEGSSYNWMDTYGDLVTNLLCFFVLLYASSSMDESKWNSLVEAFSQTPTNVPVPNFDVTFARQDAIARIDPLVSMENREQHEIPSQDSSDEQAPDTAEEIEQVFDRLYRNILQFIEDNHLEENMSAERNEDFITIRFGEVFLFRSGDATLIDDSSELIESIVMLMSANLDVIEEIKVEGHTDNVPIHTDRYRSNWELSTARAASVLQKILSFDVLEPKILTASGCGEYWPVDTNDTAEGRARNRRVDIVIEKLDV